MSALLKLPIFLMLASFSRLNAQSLRPPTTIYMPVSTYSSSYPYITGNTVRACCDHVLDHTKTFDATRVKKGDTIFTMVDYLEYFFAVMHPQIGTSYILVTHNFYDSSDDNVPGNYARYLEDPKLFAWFTQNVDRVHPKLHPLPIGLANSNYEHGNIPLLESFIAVAGKLLKTKLLYMNFSIGTHRQERQYVYDFFKKKSFCTNATRRTVREYLRDLSEHKFVLSPRGNGLDCHRTWEALLMGCYPIVKSSTLNPLYEDLPVVIVQSWDEVDKEFLETKYRELKSKKYSREKLFMNYWLEQLQAVQKLARQ